MAETNWTAQCAQRRNRPMKDRTSQMNRPNRPLKALNPTGGATYRVWELGREREFMGMRPFADHVGSALTDWKRRIRIRTYGGVGGRSSNLRLTRFASVALWGDQFRYPVDTTISNVALLMRLMSLSK